MSLLPECLVAIEDSGMPRPGTTWFNRAHPTGRSEADWDDIIAHNAWSLTLALRAGGAIREDSTLHFAAKQVDNVDVLFVETSDERSTNDSSKWGPPRRLVLLEDKLVTNAEAKRQVLAQVIDYAHYVQHNWRAISLQQLVPEHSEWLTKHREELDALIHEGDLLLVIAGNDISNDLLNLARRFSVRKSPLALNELCLVSMALYSRGEDTLLIPHVVSAVTRHERALTIKVKVVDRDDNPVPVSAISEVNEAPIGRRPLPTDANVKAFLLRARNVLDPKLQWEGGPYTWRTENVRKSLDYSHEEKSGGWVSLRSTSVDSREMPGHRLKLE